MSHPDPIKTYVDPLPSKMKPKKEAAILERLKANHAIDISILKQAGKLTWHIDCVTCKVIAEAEEDEDQPSPRGER
jgi:hypothetical protein